VNFVQNFIKLRAAIQEFLC